ncbi:uncharacterized protein LOC124123685 isoform X1 [Haliotis rufescens]|uniref:uncharacterized protein LOC124123685 isoform X1 n=1 Tax=Haliotis rufescens TaxID=6454 RepID=UPI00201F7638|nr:uncharacterized protein LOC124123685 isoform X1 [Haliotis rufescens]
MGNTVEYQKKSSAHAPTVLLQVQEVNKRTLGKLIIKTVGHEGTETDEEGTYLRRQIQACISNLEHHKPALWKDARVSFYGLQGHEYVIQSGGGRHRFVVFLDAKDEVTLTKRK